MGVLTKTALMIFYTLAFTLMLIIVPGIPPDIKFEAYQVRPPRKMEGKLTPNDILDKAELVVDGKFHGPESVALRGNDVFTGVQGGEIVKIDVNGKLKTVAKIDGGNCEGTWKSPCPRPLGLRFARNGKLLVADASYGIFEVDVDSGSVKSLLPINTLLDDGSPLKFPDDLDVDRNGVIYFSDASKVATMSNVYTEALGEPTGRLVKFDPSTKTTEILIEGVHFANGVQLSRKEDFVLICESMRSRVLKYHLTGPKKGVTESFIEGLPGVPDNLRSNGKGGFYISLVMPDTEENPNTLRYFLPLPSLRKLVLRFQYILHKAIELVDEFVPNSFCKAAHNYISHLGPAGNAAAFGSKVIIVEVDETGNIIGSLQNKNGGISSISEIGLGEKYTYFGSPYTDKLWRIKTEYLF